MFLVRYGRAKIGVLALLIPKLSQQTVSRPICNTDTFYNGVKKPAHNGQGDDVAAKPLLEHEVV